MCVCCMGTVKELKTHIIFRMHSRIFMYTQATTTTTWTKKIRVRKAVKFMLLLGRCNIQKIELTSFYPLNYIKAMKIFKWIFCLACGNHQLPRIAFFYQSTIK